MKKALKVFAAKGFTGHYPVGTAAVVVAKDKETAIAMLDAVLKEEHLPGLDADDKENVVELNLTSTSVLVLNNGDY